MTTQGSAQMESSVLFEATVTARNGLFDQPLPKLEARTLNQRDESFPRERAMSSSRDLFCMAVCAGLWSKTGGYLTPLGRRGARSHEEGKEDNHRRDGE